MKPEVFTKEIVVVTGYVDELKHVNNVQYLQWVQDIAAEHWTSRATADLLRYKWVVLNHFIEYFKPAFEGDVVKVSTYIGTTTGVRCDRFVEFWKEELLIAKARSQWCMIDEKTMRPQRVPENMYRLFMID